MKIALVVLATLFFSLTAHAQHLQPNLYPARQSPSENFSDQAEKNLRQVLVISAYSAGFGAALGASLIPFLPRQSLSNVRYVLGGASLGFVLGTGYGFYLMSGGSAAQQAPVAPDYGYGGYSFQQELSPAERRFVHEQRQSALEGSGFSVRAYETRW